MKAIFSRVAVAAIPLVAGVLLAPGSAAAANEDAAKELARANNCFKCHALKKDKDGPSWTKVSEKYRGKPDAQDRLVKHLTTGELAKFPDGHEEKHKIIKTDPENDTAQIKNLVDYILSLQ
jgi:cytochrome c